MKNKITFKKTITFILLVAVVSIGVLAPLGLGGVNTVSAGEETDSLLAGVWCFDWYEGLSVSGCAAISSSHLYEISALVLEVTGHVFNSFLAFSIDSNTINQDFVTNAWGSIRNFANLLFIFVLVAISISIILGIGMFNSKQLIRDVIIIALMVNFSLFAARVVIDAGNITALGFYDAIAVTENNSKNIAGMTIKEKNISGGVMSVINPTKLIDIDSFKNWKDRYVDKKKGRSDANLALVAIYLFGSAISLYMAYLFFMGGWIFIVRIAYLWIIMILGPLAFLAFVIPKARSQWTRWWTELFNKSFAITVFMFFIWLTLYITDDEKGGGFFSSAFDPSKAGDLTETLVIIGLQFLVIVTLLQITLKATKAMSDDKGLGNKMFGLLKGVGSMALGAATGGASFIARQGVGMVAAGGAKSLKKKGLGATRFGKMRLQAHRALENYGFGAKEGYKERKEKIAEKHVKYMKSLKKEVKDKRGNVVAEPQREYRSRIKKSAGLVSFMLGERAGEKKFVSQYDKAEKKTIELRLRQEKLSNTTEKIKKLRKTLPEGIVTSSEIDKLIDAQSTLQDKITKLREDIKKTGVGVVKERDIPAERTKEVRDKLKEKETKEKAQKIVEGLKNK